MSELTHFDEKGQAIMVDVGPKQITERLAVAHAKVYMKPETLELIIQGATKKGRRFGVARIAGIMAAKKTPELIPLAHPLPLNSVTIEFSPDRESGAIDVKGAGPCYSEDRG